MNKLNLRQELTSKEVERFTKRYSEEKGRDVAFRDIPIKNFVDVASGLLETKVSQLFMKGAADEAGFYSSLIRVVNMTSPIQQVPIVSQRDVKIRKGKISGAALEGSGGKVRSVKLDTTDDEKIRYALLNIDAEDVKLRNFNYIEQMIVAAGAAFSKNILGDVLSQYVNKAGNTQALGGDKYFVAVMKAIGLNKADGFGCSAIIVDYQDFVQAVTEETTGGTMPWLMSLQNGNPLGDNFGKNFGAVDGLVGYLFNRIPVYAVSNDSNLSGNILCVDVPAAAALGFGPGGEIMTAQAINNMRDLVHNKIQAKYDINNPDDGSGNTNAVAKVTGA